MTSRYLLSTIWSSSSIGGLMMPSAPWVTATCCHSSLTRVIQSSSCHLRRTGPAPARTGGLTCHGHQDEERSLITVNQRYHLPVNLIDRSVNQRHVELADRGELFPRHRQAPL